MNRQQFYALIDGQTTFSAADMNPRLFDIDTRLGAMELMQPSLASAIDDLTQLGVARINSALLPAFTQITAIQTLGFLVGADRARLQRDFRDRNDRGDDRRVERRPVRAAAVGRAGPRRQRDRLSDRAGAVLLLRPRAPEACWSPIRSASPEPIPT